MSAHRVYRNLQVIPRIWGVTFYKLFAVLFGGLIAMLPLMYLIPKLLAFAVTIGIVLFGYVICLALDARDPVEYQGRRFRWIRNRLTCYTLSNKRMKMGD